MPPGSPTNTASSTTSADSQCGIGYSPMTATFNFAKYRYGFRLFVLTVPTNAQRRSECSQTVCFCHSLIGRDSTVTYGGSSGRRILPRVPCGPRGNAQQAGDAGQSVCMITPVESPYVQTVWFSRQQASKLQPCFEHFSRAARATK